MISVLDFTLGLLSVYGPPDAYAQAKRVRRTLDWMERSCRDEVLPRRGPTAVVYHAGAAQF